jgi:hypothetical protein
MQGKIYYSECNNNNMAIGKRKRKKNIRSPVSLLLAFSGSLLFLFNFIMILHLLVLASKRGVELMELVYIPLIEAAIFVLIGIALIAHGLSSKLE